jgi:nitrogen fixation protein
VLGCEAGAKPPEQDRHEPVVLVRSVDGAGGKCLVMRA